MNASAAPRPSTWADLSIRLGSGLVLAAAGLALIWLGGWWFAGLAVAVTGLMTWELAAMTARGRFPALSVGLGLVAAAGLGVALWVHRPYWLALLLLPALLGLVTPRRDRILFALYALVIQFTGYGLVAFREGYGLGFVLWLVVLVVVADMGGYFGGRLIGGPKFWPRVSPKKTWAGTVSGWAGAALAGAVMAWAAGGPGWLPAFSVLVALASQMGDIGESAIKRRAGIKDSSNLIPGHGGAMDRFDALAGAVVFVLAWGMLSLPVPVFAD
jgi:phosphatidate cytidylyltransferase